MLTKVSPEKAVRNKHAGKATLEVVAVPFGSFPGDFGIQPLPAKELSHKKVADKASNMTSNAATSGEVATAMIMMSKEVTGGEVAAATIVINKEVISGEVIHGEVHPHQMSPARK